MIFIASSLTVHGEVSAQKTPAWKPSRMNIHGVPGVVAFKKKLSQNMGT